MYSIHSVVDMDESTTSSIDEEVMPGRKKKGVGSLNENVLEGVSIVCLTSVLCVYFRFVVIEFLVTGLENY